MRDAGQRNAEIERAAPPRALQMINSWLEQNRVVGEGVGGWGGGMEGGRIKIKGNGTEMQG